MPEYALKTILACVKAPGGPIYYRYDELKGFKMYSPIKSLAVEHRAIVSFISALRGGLFTYTLSSYESVS